MSKGHYINMANLKTENAQLKSQADRPALPQVNMEVSFLKLRVQTLEQENKQKEEEIQKLIRLLNRH